MGKWFSVFFYFCSYLFVLVLMGNFDFITVGAHVIGYVVGGSFAVHGANFAEVVYHPEMLKMVVNSLKDFGCQGYAFLGFVCDCAAFDFNTALNDF
ncbi:hypothetical protein MMJ63_19875 [Bacillus vallismortis]|nr:hypothetical protein [Bacillus vallismortis]